MEKNIENIREKLSTRVELTMFELEADKYLSIQDMKFVRDTLTNFTINAVFKYIEGQKEHGGKITDRDLDTEIDQEHIDLFWYLAARKTKSRA